MVRTNVIINCLFCADKSPVTSRYRSQAVVTKMAWMHSSWEERTWIGAPQGLYTNPKSEDPLVFDTDLADKVTGPIFGCSDAVVSELDRPSTHPPLSEGATVCPDALSVFTQGTCVHT